MLKLSKALLQDFSTGIPVSFLSRVFHKLDEIGNNANIGIRFFTT